MTAIVPIDAVEVKKAVHVAGKIRRLIILWPKA